MEYALKERIGKPELFVGRKKELNFFLNWIDNIKNESSKSMAILARRKMGKTALMERLFNITFYKNDGVIPFYYEIKETKLWQGAFCQEFFLTFIYQYIAFKSRNPQYLYFENRSDFKKAIEIAQKEGLSYLCDIIESADHALSHDKIDTLWEIVREAPKTIAALRNEYIVQMIDEFQFLNSMIYWDKAKSKDQLADTLAGGYLSTAESKIAPLLVSGSWVGWLMNLLMEMLPSRFRNYPLDNMTLDEAVEMIYKYSGYFGIPVSEETVYLMAQLAEGSPFYISSIMNSLIEDKDLMSIEGLSRVFEFETLDTRGMIKSTWMEYISGALPRINDRNGKSIVLYLCKHRDREVTRKELMDELKLDMTDAALENKLKALVNSDIIRQGATNFRYQGVKDNIFDKVFRGVYQEEIDIFDPDEIKKEYKKSFELQKRKYKRLLGKFNYQKGLFAEYKIIDRLRLHAQKENNFLKSITHNLPGDFNFSTYDYVWKYSGSSSYSTDYSVDIFARATNINDYSIIGEIKNRDTKKFSKEEVDAFWIKLNRIKEKEKLVKTQAFIFSRKGFTEEAEAYCNAKGIAYSDNEDWFY